MSDPAQSGDGAEMRGIEPVDRRTWTLDVSRQYHLDAPQKAKSWVAENYDVDYRHLRARVVKKWGSKAVVVVDMGRQT